MANLTNNIFHQKYGAEVTPAFSININEGTRLYCAVPIAIYRETTTNKDCVVSYPRWKWRTYRDYETKEIIRQRVYTPSDDTVAVNTFSARDVVSFEPRIGLESNQTRHYTARHIFLPFAGQVKRFDASCSYDDLVLLRRYDAFLKGYTKSVENELNFSCSYSALKSIRFDNQIINGFDRYLNMEGYVEGSRDKSTYVRCELNVAPTFWIFRHFYCTPMDLRLSLRKYPGERYVLPDFSMNGWNVGVWYTREHFGVTLDVYSMQDWSDGVVSRIRLWVK
jgi:hypothetical protein